MSSITTLFRMQYRKNYQRNQYPTRGFGRTNQGRAYGYVPEHEKVTMGVDSIEKLESIRGKTITGQALTDSYMAISKVKANAIKELVPVREENSFGMAVTLKMNEITVPTQMLAQDVNRTNKDMIESVPVALSYQSMTENRCTIRECMVSSHSIPSWKCFVLGREKETRVHEVLKMLRHFMRSEWILDVRVEMKEFEADKVFICVWMLSVDRFFSYDQCDSKRADTWVFEDLRAEKLEYRLMNQTIQDNQTDGQEVPTTCTNQTPKTELKREPENSVISSNHTKIE